MTSSPHLHQVADNKCLWTGANPSTVRPSTTARVATYFSGNPECTYSYLSSGRQSRRVPLTSGWRVSASDLARFSVSLEADLLRWFDRYCTEGKFATRSEAVRQLLRHALTDEAVSGPAEDAAGTLTLVYDHHKSGLPEKLLEIQHRHGALIVSTTHVHLDHHLCLEVLIMRGRADKVREAAAEIRGLKGIRKGQLVLATTPDIP